MSESERRCTASDYIPVDAGATVHHTATASAVPAPPHSLNSRLRLTAVADVAVRRPAAVWRHNVTH